jgi:hypothetical protein
MLQRVLLSLSLTCALALPAAAAPAKKKAAATAKAEAPKANEKAVSELMGPWRWGMSVDEVLAALHKQLADRAAPELAKINDVYEQTRIRKNLKTDVDVVRRSLIKFEGQRTGWDVSIIEGEFLHKNDESMMHYREVDPATGRDQQRFFFFHDGKLYKQFIAFNMEAYKGKTFDDFRAAMETRYGKGAAITRSDREGKQKVVGVGWRSGGTNLRAIDLMQFYANFCLAFSDAGVDVKLDAERLARAPKVVAPRAEVSDGPASDDKVHDPNADIIDRITGTAPDPATPDDGAK